MPAAPQPDAGTLRLPRWVAARARPLGSGDGTRALLKRADLVTVCEEARCPNLAHCYGRGVATFMVLGEVCTRACAFCAVDTGTPAPPDPGEPERLARAAAGMALRHVVVTSVDRDDLADGGIGHFARTVAAIREALPAATVEVLTPDFRGVPDAAARVAALGADVFNHNVETVPRLYDAVRPGADYGRSLDLLREVKTAAPGIFVKSGLMVGLGETDEELIAVFRDLRAAGCDVLTVGQYLRPTARHRPVARYVPPEGFARLKETALALGFAHVAAGPMVRSSFHADGHFRAARRGGNQP
jgi:lipoic acid synthetase